MRRFEYIKGNAAKFWEVFRRGELITTTSGKIGTEGQTKNKSYADYMAAEVDFDRLIRDKIKRGFMEVAEASEPPSAIPERTLDLFAMEADDGIRLSGAQSQYLIWRMVELGIMDRHESPVDLTRWSWRAARRMRLESVPDPEEEIFDAFHDEWLRLSGKDRASRGVKADVAGYKFVQGAHWVVTPEECLIIAARTSMKPKRHSPTQRQRRWVEEFIEFNEQASEQGGYEIIPFD